ncbi:MAG: BTAD domain-containing putative transcriptional regulator [Gammaproteobacteria bacterium]
MMVSTTKISRPEIAGVYLRERLLDALQPAPGYTADFVTAPAGAGKTTLLASYQQAVDPAGIWYRIDPGDADPAAFFYYLGMAVRRASPRRKKPMPLLTADHLPSIRIFARMFFEALFSRIGHSGCLVLDDYHHLPEESLLHDLIRESLALLPGEFQVIMASRGPAPAAFAGLIANRQMRLLGWEALKLDESECRGILELHGESAAVDFSRLVETTDGWVAGLILLLQSGEIARLDQLRSGSESQSLMFDYFAGEVFRGHDPGTRDFLLKTSLLSQMTLETARELTGDRRAGTILSDLARYQYFTFRRRNKQDYYEYHALFRGFLLSRAQKVYPAEEWRTLNVRAAELEKAAGHLDSALDLYFRAGDHASLESLILEHAASLVSQGRFLSLETWIGSVTAARREQSPWLRYWSAQCALPTDSAAALRHFEAAFEGFQDLHDTRGLLLAWCGAVDTYIYRWDRFQPLDRWIAWMDGWLAQDGIFPDERVEGYVACAFANALFYREYWRPEIGQWFERAWQIAWRSDEPNQMAQTGVSYLNWSFRIGAIEKSLTLIDFLHQTIDLKRVSPLLRIVFKSTTGLAHYLLSEEKQSPVDIADIYNTDIKEGLELADRSGIHFLDAQFHAWSAYAALAIGDADRAAISLAQVEAANHSFPHLLNQSHYLCIRGWEHYQRQSFQLAAEYSEASLKTLLETGCTFPLGMVHTGLALALFDHGQKTRAFEAIEQAIRETRTMGAPLLEYHALFALAYIRITEGISEESLATLREALSLGRMHGYEFSAVWWHPPMLERVLGAALDHGIEPKFVAAFIRRRGFLPENPPTVCRNWPWPVKIHCFGGFRVVKQGTPLGFGRKSPKKPLELLKAVVAFGGEVADRTLIDALWPDSDGDTAHNAFSTTLKRLRDLVGAEVLILNDGRVKLDPRRVWIDIRAFEDLADRADTAEKSDQESFLRLAQEALDLCSGPFLATDPDAAWALATRERLRARLLALLGRAGRCLEANNLWSQALAWYQRALDVDLLAEEFYQGLMCSHLHLGCRADGVKAYQRCRQALSISLGIQPGPATEQLYRRLLDG